MREHKKLLVYVIITIALSLESHCKLISLLPTDDWYGTIQNTMQAGDVVELSAGMPRKEISLLALVCFA